MEEMTKNLEPKSVAEDYADRILKNATLGYTPTHAELDKIWDHIFRAGHGWTPPEMRGASPKAPEPSVPEAVKDLTCSPEQVATLDGVNKEIAIRANNAIAEAYRRGQKVGSRA